MTSILRGNQWNPDFSNLQGKRKLVREIGIEISGVTDYSETNPRETTFGSSYRGFSRSEHFFESEV